MKYLTWWIQGPDMELPEKMKYLHIWLRQQGGGGGHDRKCFCLSLASPTLSGWWCWWWWWFHLRHLLPWIAIIISTTYWTVMLVIIISTTNWTVMLNFGICQTFELSYQALWGSGKSFRLRSLLCLEITLQPAKLTETLCCNIISLSTFLLHLFHMRWWIENWPQINPVPLNSPIN